MLTATVRVMPPRALNTSWYLDVNSFARQTAWAHGFMHAYALWAGLTVLAILLVAAYFFCRFGPQAPRQVAITAVTGIAALVALGVNQGVGHAAGELRPFISHPSALVLVGKTNDFAFPSDHCVVAGAFIVGLFMVSWRWGTAATVLGLLLGFARVYVGVHYPGDAVAGLLLGGVICVLLQLMLRRLMTRLAGAVVRTRFRPFVMAAGGGAHRRRGTLRA